MSAQNGDPVLSSLRDEIAAADRGLLAAFCRRVQIATRIHSYKQERGYEHLDPEREQELLAEWRQANDGTISDETLVELFKTVLRLSKRETGRGE